MSHRKSLGGFCLVVALCLMFAGCKTIKETIEIPVYIHDTTQTVREVHDSTYIDRWNTIYQKGDTVYWHDSIVFVKYHIKTDTAYKYVELPVTVTKTETIEVEKPLKWFQKVLIWIGIISLTTFVVCLFRAIKNKIK